MPTFEHMTQEATGGSDPSKTEIQGENYLKVKLIGKIY
jgi:hypothetical protein